jgi:shikimate kinase
MAPKLILTGFMASGKSAVARTAARRLGWRLIDCDAEIVALARKPITEIFRDDGEERFRHFERQVIAALDAGSPRCAGCGEPRPAVVATGGGAIVDPVNAEAMRRAGVVICLTARPEVILRRIGRNARHRPMLAAGGKPLEQRVAELMQARREAYARAAVTIDTSRFNIEQATDAVLKAFSEYHARAWRASA